jgi:succinate dehydrogenase / fumarate reductase cytochrome b subunit
MIGFAMTSDSSKRPLSPHLQVYRWQLTMVMSILHRITGAALSVGTLMLAWWLIAAMMGEGAYNIAMDFAHSPLGIFMLFGWSAALYYHLFNGIRHLFWDTGRLLKLKDAYLSGYIVLLLTILATAATWYEVYS